MVNSTFWYGVDSMKIYCKKKIIAKQNYCKKIYYKKKVLVQKCTELFFTEENHRTNTSQQEPY